MTASASEDPARAEFSTPLTVGVNVFMVVDSSRFGSSGMVTVLASEDSARAESVLTFSESRFSVNVSMVVDVDRLANEVCKEDDFCS